MTRTSDHATSSCILAAAGLALAVTAIVSATGCVAVPTIHRVESRSLAVEYVAEHDRIISVEPAHGPNLLKRVDFALKRHAKGKESLIGGMHLQCLNATPPLMGADTPSCACCAHKTASAAAGPASVWDWDSALGPTYVTSLAADAYQAASMQPVQAAPGTVIWQRGLSLDANASSAEAFYSITNVGDEPMALRLASLATVGRNAVIWVPVPDNGQAVILDGPRSVETWEQIATVTGRWLEIPAGGRAWKGKRRNTISARILPAAPVIAVWTQNYWFVRVLQPGDETSDQDCLVDLRFDHRAWLFHARLVGPETHPGRGQTADLIERWYVVWSPNMNIDAVDAVLTDAGITWDAPVIMELEVPTTQPIVEERPADDSIEVQPTDDEAIPDANEEDEFIDIEEIIDG